MLFWSINHLLSTQEDPALTRWTYARTNIFSHFRPTAKTSLIGALFGVIPLFFWYAVFKTDRVSIFGYVRWSLMYWMCVLMKSLFWLQVFQVEVCRLLEMSGNKILLMYFFLLIICVVTRPQSIDQMFKNVQNTWVHILTISTTVVFCSWEEKSDFPVEFKSNYIRLT